MEKQLVIVGLGLIGGSLAKALRGFEDYRILGVDVSQPTLRYALEQNIVDRAEEDPVRALAQGDLVFLCLHPQGIVDFMAAHRDHFKPGAMVTDVCGVKGELVEGKLSDFAEERKLDIVKVLVMVEPEKREPLRERLTALLGEEYYVTSSSDWLVEVMPAGQNKGCAVAFLSEYYQIPKERIAAAGDQLNDLPMLQAAGGKFTVSNGVAALKRVAEVIPSNEEDGVAYALEHYVMKGDAGASEGGQDE